MSAAIALALATSIAVPADAIAAPRTGVITGTVVDTSGKPVGSIKVTAKDDSGVAVTGRTDALGRFYLFGLAPSTYGLKFSAFNGERVRFASEWLGDALSYTGSTKIRIGAGDKKSGVREVIGTGSDISGRISIDGRPATASDGIIVSGPKVGNGDGVASVSAAPSFHFHDVDFGNQILTVSSSTGAFAPFRLVDPRDGNTVFHVNGVDKVAGVHGVVG